MRTRVATLLLLFLVVAAWITGFSQTAVAASATPTGLTGHIRNIVSTGSELLAVNTDDGHIYKYDGSSWTDNVSLGARCLYRDPWGNIYAGTSGGNLYQYGGGTTWNLHGNMPWSIPAINCITADATHVYVGCTNGYVYVNQEGEYSPWFSIGGPGASVRCMVQMAGHYGGWWGECLYVGADGITDTSYWYWPQQDWKQDWWGPGSQSNSIVNSGGTRVHGCENGHVYATSDCNTFYDWGGPGGGAVNVLNWDTSFGYAGCGDGHVYWYDGASWHDAGTSMTNAPVRDITFMGGKLYTATDDGVYSFSPSQVATTGSDTVTAGGARLTGQISEDGNTLAGLRGFAWRPEGGEWSYWSESGTFSKTDPPFSNTVTGLGPNTTYEFKARAFNGASWAEGNVMTFKTQVAVQTLTTGAPTGIGQRFATLNGSIADTGGENADQRGFRYRQTGSSSWNQWTVSGSFGAGAYSHVTASELAPDTEYEYQSVSHNSAGWAEGPLVQFHTLHQPSVTTAAATSIVGTGAVLNGNVNDTGGENVTRGFRYQVADSGSWVEWTDTGTYGTGAYIYTVTGLKPGTRYEFQATACNTDGSATGDSLFFTTVDNPAVATVPPASVGLTEATLQGRITATGGESASERGFRYREAGDAEWTEWSESGPHDAGPFVHAVTGLNGATRYEYQAMALNSAGRVYGSSVYLTTDFTVRASVSGGPGTVNPGSQVIGYDGIASINLSPSPGYMLSTITDNGVAKALARPYVISNVRADHEVTVTFSKVSVIMSVSPDRGPAGTTVTIKGNDFGSRTTASGSMSEGPADWYVSFNQLRATEYESWTNTEIRVKVPEGSTSGPVTVTTSLGTSNADHTFTVTEAVTPRYYLAEGSTAHGFDTSINIENPTADNLNAKVDFLLSDGKTRTFDIGLFNGSQTTLNPRDLIGEQDFSTRVECVQGKTIAVDRTMTWTGPGSPSPGGHSSVGTTAPQKTWYLAEGSSKWGFETWTLVENPNDRPVRARLTYMIEGEIKKVVDKNLPANARGSFAMKDDIGEKDASVKVDCDLPVVAERSMYRNQRREGSCSIGTPSPGSDFYLAEGTTDWGFTTYVLVQNPGTEMAEVTITCMTNSGPLTLKPFELAGESRKTVCVNDEVPGKDFSLHVSADRPIVAERAMYWGAGTAQGEACHSTIGVCSTHRAFYMPDGSTENGTETFTLVGNPNNVKVQVEISYLMAVIPGSRSYAVTFRDTLEPNTRRTYAMGDMVRGKASIEVTSLTAGKGIVVERSMYWNSRAAGTDTIGGYSD